MTLLSCRYAIIGAYCAFAFAGSIPSLHAQPPGGGPSAPDLEIMDQFDVDQNGVLNREERAAAFKHLANRPQNRGGPGRGRGGPGGRGGEGRQVGSPGPWVTPEEVTAYPNAGLYERGILRTFFLEFEDEDWEEQLEAFKPTDIEVPATLTVDGTVYPNVGLSFRGASSFFMIPAGSKRSFNLSMDFVDDQQRLYDYKSLNLLNCNGDASLLSSYLYAEIASKKIATPKVNFVKVVINGRSWGIYANAQQFNKDFLKENYDSGKGSRWKVNGSPSGDGGLRYLGEELAPYRKRYEIKSKDEEQAWHQLRHLCQLIEETPTAELEEVLEPILDIDGTLWFLAVDVALVNSDGYWTRASDYNIYLNKEGKFHILPHDMNEAFHGRGGSRGGPPGPGRFGPPGFGGFGFGGFGFGGPPSDEPARPNRERNARPQGMGRNAALESEQLADRGPTVPRVRPEQGPGRARENGGLPGPGPAGSGGRGGSGGDRFGGRGFGGPRGGGARPSIDLDPLVGLDSDRFALRSKLLANETLRNRYLQYVRLIAEELLDWNYIGEHVAEARELIKQEVKQDTRKLSSYEAFLQATEDKQGDLRKFCDQRAEYLLGLEVIQDLPTKRIALTHGN